MGSDSLVERKSRCTDRRSEQPAAVPRFAPGWSARSGRCEARSNLARDFDGEFRNWRCHLCARCRALELVGRQDDQPERRFPVRRLTSGTSSGLTLGISAVRWREFRSFRQQRRRRRLLLLVVQLRRLLRQPEPPALLRRPDLRLQPLQPELPGEFGFGVIAAHYRRCFQAQTARRSTREFEKRRARQHPQNAVRRLCPIRSSRRLRQNLQISAAFAGSLNLKRSAWFMLTGITL